MKTLSLKSFNSPHLNASFVSSISFFRCNKIEN